MSNPSISTEELHNLLTRLFPDTQLSPRGVDLLAVQIAKLETESAFMHYGINDHFIPDPDFQSPQDYRPLIGAGCSHGALSPFLANELDR